jgi:HNH endonuclease
MATGQAWIFAFGPKTPGLYVLHRCDNPPCVRPDHLFLGTNVDNNRDRNAKGRSSTHIRSVRGARGLKGSANPLAALTSAQVRLIRQRYAKGELQRALAREFGVSQATISHVVNGVTYS